MGQEGKGAEEGAEEGEGVGVPLYPHPTLTLVTHYVEWTDGTSVLKQHGHVHALQGMLQGTMQETHNQPLPTPPHTHHAGPNPAEGDAESDGELLPLEAPYDSQ